MPDVSNTCSISVIPYFQQTHVPSHYLHVENICICFQTTYILGYFIFILITIIYDIFLYVQYVHVCVYVIYFIVFILIIVL